MPARRNKESNAARHVRPDLRAQDLELLSEQRPQAGDYSGLIAPSLAEFSATLAIVAVMGSIASTLIRFDMSAHTLDSSRSRRAYHGRPETCPLWLGSTRNEVTSRPLSEPGDNSGGQFVAIDACHLLEPTLGPAAAKTRSAST